MIFKFWFFPLNCIWNLTIYYIVHNLNIFEFIKFWFYIRHWSTHVILQIEDPLWYWQNKVSPNSKIFAEMHFHVSAKLCYCLKQASWTLWGWEGVIFHQYAIVIDFKALKLVSAHPKEIHKRALSHCAMTTWFYSTIG